MSQHSKEPKKKPENREIDMSPDAIGERLDQVGALYRLAMSLKAARVIDERR